MLGKMVPLGPGLVLKYEATISQMSRSRETPKLGRRTWVDVGARGNDDLLGFEKCRVSVVTDGVDLPDGLVGGGGNDALDAGVLFGLGAVIFG